MEGHLSTRDSRRTTLTAALVVPPEERDISWCKSFRVVFFSVVPVFLSILSNVFSATMTISFISGQFDSVTEEEEQSDAVGAIALGIGINNCVLRTFILGYNMGMMTLAAQGAGKGGEAAKFVPEYMNRTLFSGICLMVIMDGIMLFL